MEVIAYKSIICIAIMCELYCTFRFFNITYKDEDELLDIFSKFVIAALVGWIFVPIILGIKNNK